MARRIKEEPTVHRERIATAAGDLFKERGTTKVTVNQIADRAGYSKATVYAYFENKDEIISYLVLKSMALLKKEIVKNTSKTKSNQENFMGICRGLLKYHEKFPMYFDMLQSNINVDFSDNKYYESELDTYIVGRQITDYLADLFNLGDDSFIKIFAMWASICGVIRMAANKEEYIQKESSMSQKDFYNAIFEIMYKVIE